MQPNETIVTKIDTTDEDLGAMTMPVGIATLAPVPPAPISPNASLSKNASLHVKPSMSTFLRPLLIIIVAFSLLGGGVVIGYAFGSNKSVSTVSTTTGWRLVPGGVTAKGSSIPIPQNIDVLLVWNITKNAHDPHAVWYVVTHTTKTTAKGYTIDALRDEQGNVTITDNTSTGNQYTFGTAHGNELQVTLPLDSRLYPETTPIFLTLTFAPADVASFNQILQGVQP